MREESLTVPSEAQQAALDERRYAEDAPAVRSESQRDRDRILYSSAFLRLGHITQVAAPEVGHIFHSRLTHSLKVAQVARRTAERLRRLRENGELGPKAAALIDVLDEDAVEAAALAHDIGHPPFGHLAEKVLQANSNEYGSFEGNPQSFRIVTRLALRDLDNAGLNLTRRTLNGLLKYPWLRETDTTLERLEKWGAYDGDREYFQWVRSHTSGTERSIEAVLMDWADDVTYAVHDMDDFYRAGLIPLDRLREGGEEFRFFSDYLRRKKPESADALIEAGERLFQGILTMRSRYHGHASERVNLRQLGSRLITRYINAPRLSDGDGDGEVRFELNEREYNEVNALKQLTWCYIIERPSLATIQEGQRQTIEHLFKMYLTAATAAPPDLRLFPTPIAERVDAAQTPGARARAVVDLISGMTESSATTAYRQAIGAVSGSVLASASGPS